MDPKQLQSLPNHIVFKITTTWGSIELKEYLDSLLTDTRGGTRRGFTLEQLSAITEAIKLNTALLEGMGYEFEDFHESVFVNSKWQLPPNF